MQSALEALGQVESLRATRNIHDLLQGIDRALGAVGRFEQEIRSDPQRAHEMAVEIDSLRSGVHRLKARLAAASQFYAGLAQILGMAPGGYTPAGEPTPIQAAARISVEA